MRSDEILQLVGLIEDLICFMVDPEVFEEIMPKISEVMHNRYCKEQNNPKVLIVNGIGGLQTAISVTHLTSAAELSKMIASLQGKKQKDNIDLLSNPECLINNIDSVNRIPDLEPQPELKEFPIKLKKKRMSRIQKQALYGGKK